MKQENKTTILFLSADPRDAARLRLGQEQREIHEKLQLAKLRDKFSLEIRSSVRPGDMVQALHDTRPKIVHFSGHGTEAGEICLENEFGEIHPVTPEALTSLFKLVRSYVNCVILNACYSESQARAIAKHIDFVIGMDKAIGDEAAIAFSVGFYKALGAGSTVEDAFEFGVVELRLKNILEHLTPIIKRKRKSSKVTRLPSTKSDEILKTASMSRLGTILVADDEPDIRRNIEKTLEKEGYTVRTANNYEQALQEINQNSFDLIILDIRMPDWSGKLSKRAGVDVLIEIRARGLTLPVIMLSAQEDVGLAIEAIKHDGATDYLVKGDITMKDFTQKIRGYLGANSTFQ